MFEGNLGARRSAAVAVVEQALEDRRRVSAISDGAGRAAGRRAAAPPPACCARTALTSAADARPTRAGSALYVLVDVAQDASGTRGCAPRAPSRGGKYVPPKNGSRSGVSQTLIGQPPDPVSACTAAM